MLKEAIAKENWDVKGKFPPGLKPILGQVALKAVILGEYDDNFFNLMPRLFPYNKFTMTVCLSVVLGYAQVRDTDDGAAETHKADNMA